MSKIEKCPLCGNPQVETLNEHAMPSGAYCCGVRCDSIEKWNKYAALETHHNALREAVVHVYNSGYLAGHLDTVEGGYVDIHSNDMDTHHKEEVAELLTFLLEEK